MKKLTCKAVAPYLTQEAREALSTADREKVLAHLAVCPSCQTASQRAERLDEDLASLREPAPVELLPQILTAIREKRARTRTRQRVLTRLMPMAACFCLIVSVLLTLSPAIFMEKAGSSAPDADYVGGADDMPDAGDENASADGSPMEPDLDGSPIPEGDTPAPPAGSDVDDEASTGTDYEGSDSTGNACGGTGDESYGGKDDGMDSDTEEREPATDEPYEELDGTHADKAPITPSQNASKNSSGPDAALVIGILLGTSGILIFLLWILLKRKTKR